MATTTVVSVPQFSVGTQEYTVASTAATYSNQGVITGDPFYSSLFRFSGANPQSLILTTASPPVATPGTTFTIRDTLGVADTVILVATVPAFNVSSNIVLYKGIPDGLPITLTPPSNATGAINDGSFITLVQRSISGFDFKYGGYFVPALSTIGLGFTVDPSSGVVSITGVPNQVRPASNYTYFVTNSRGDQIRTEFSVQILPFTYLFSNVSGAIVDGSNVGFELKYNSFNDVRVGFRPSATSITFGPLPNGISAAYPSPGEIRLSGNTGVTFIDPPFSSYINFSGPYGTTRMELTFSMTPVLLLEGPTDVYGYNYFNQDVNKPFGTFLATRYPLRDDTLYSWKSSKDQVVGYTIEMAGNGRIAALVGVGGADNQQTVVSVQESGGLIASQTVTFHGLSDNINFLLGTPTTRTITQNTPITLSYYANADSGTGLVYSSTPALVDGLYFHQNVIEGNAKVSGTFQYNILAKTWECIRRGFTPGSISLNLIVLPDTITFAPSALTTGEFHMIQGRDIAIDYDLFNRSIIGTASSGTDVKYYDITSGSLTGTGLSLSDGILSGTPTFTGQVGLNVRATVATGNAYTDLSIHLNSSPDRLLLISPGVTDFVLNIGESLTCNVFGYAFSASPITSYSLSNAPTGVTITSGGTLVLPGTTYQSATPFKIMATTFAGITLSRVATLTVNDAVPGEFISPLPSTLYFPLEGDTFPIVTDPPGFAFTLSYGGSDFDVVGSNLVRTSSATVYPRQLVTINADTNLIQPVRVVTERIVPQYPVENTNWIQYVPIDDIVLEATQPGDEVFFSIPNIPDGITWNPITRTIAGAPRHLTVGDTLMVYASDGESVEALSIQYSVRTPRYLRGFSSPSSFTNYIRQLAVVNSAVHALDSNAVLPNPLIAAQTGPYPPDVTIARYCRVNKVATNAPFNPGAFWSSYSLLDWQFGSVYYRGIQTTTPYTYLQSVSAYQICSIATGIPTISGTFTNMGGGSKRIRSQVSYGFNFTASSNVTMLCPLSASMTLLAPSRTMSYTEEDDFEMAFSNGMAYYINQGSVIGRVSVASTIALGIHASMANDGFSTLSVGVDSIPSYINLAQPYWYSRDQRRWTLTPSNATYNSNVPSAIVSLESISGCYARGIPSVTSDSGFGLTTSYGALQDGIVFNGSTFGFTEGATSYTAGNTLPVGDELAVVASNGIVYYLIDSNVVGTAAEATSAKQLRIGLGGQGDTMVDISFGSGTSAYDPIIPQLAMPYPTSKWFYSTQGFHSITHTGATGDELFGFPTIELDQYGTSKFRITARVLKTRGIVFFGSVEIGDNTSFGAYVTDTIFGVYQQGYLITSDTFYPGDTITVQIETTSEQRIDDTDPFNPIYYTVYSTIASLYRNGIYLFYVGYNPSNPVFRPRVAIEQAGDGIDVVEVDTACRYMWTITNSTGIRASTTRIQQTSSQMSDVFITEAASNVSLSYRIRSGDGAPRVFVSNETEPGSDLAAYVTPDSHEVFAWSRDSVLSGKLNPYGTISFKTGDILEFIIDTQTYPGISTMTIKVNGVIAISIPLAVGGTWRPGVRLTNPTDTLDMITYSTSLPSPPPPTTYLGFWSGSSNWTTDGTIMASAQTPGSLAYLTSLTPQTAWTDLYFYVPGQLVADFGFTTNPSAPFGSALTFNIRDAGSTTSIRVWRFVDGVSSIVGNYTIPRPFYNRLYNMTWNSGTLFIQSTALSGQDPHSATFSDISFPGTTYQFTFGYTLYGFGPFVSFPDPA